MKSKGLDHGYLYTKDSDLRMFRSAFIKSGVNIGGIPFLQINGVGYSAVGIGDGNLEFDKSDSEMNRVTTFTDLCLDGDNEYNLVVGLPISQYKAQCNKFKQIIMDYNKCEVIFKGRKMNIKINNVFVIPQGVGALLSLNEKLNDAIIFDWGSLTIDIARIIFDSDGNPVIKDYDTWIEGIQKIYGKLINKVNETYNLTLDISEAENILVNGLYINGISVSLDFLTSTIEAFIAPKLRDFKFNYPVAITPIYLAGGVFEIKLIVDIMLSHFPHAKVIPNSQRANAIGFGRFAEAKFGHNIISPVNNNNLSYARR